MTNEEAIEEIMDEFDFHKVRKVMEFLDWKWSADDEGNFSDVPSGARLRKMARSLLKEAARLGVQHGGYHISSGGFRATYYDDGILGLAFELEQWTTHE